MRNLPKKRLRSLAGAGLAALAAATLAPHAAAQGRTEGPRPNVVLIVLDDVGVDTMSGMYPGLIDRLARQYGPQGLNHPEHARIAGKPASTPVLDAFAAESMVFTQAWAQPFCSPTRASLLTGLYAARTGMLDYTSWLPQKHHSFVQDLHDAGYRTGMFGKWHVAGLNQYPGMKPKEAGFDLFLGNLNGAIHGYWEYDYQVQDAASPAGEWRSEAAPVRSLPGIAPTTYAPVVKVADTIDWIGKQEQADPQRPWFAWLAFNLSHISAGQFPNRTLVPNADTLDETSRAEMEACGGEFGTPRIGTCSAEALNRAMTNSMDTTIGKLLEAVREIDSNTYVIVLGDNGTPMYGRPGTDFIDNMYITRTGRAKGTGYESGVRVPLAIAGPGIAAGSSDAVTHVVDLFSTILGLARLPVPTAVPVREGEGAAAPDSISLAPVLFDGATAVRDPLRDYIVAETMIPLAGNELQVSARNAVYKVLCKRKDAVACEFYDLANDPLEEYPLEQPAQCPAGTARAPRAVSDRPGNFCYLRQAIDRDSTILRPAEPPQAGGRRLPARPEGRPASQP